MVYPILTDYLGCIQSTSELIPSGDAQTGQKYRRKVDIESLDGKIVEFTMWDDLATQFNKKKIDKIQFLAIIAVTSCRVSKYRDLLQLTATPATFFYVNPKTQEAKDAHALFKEKYSTNPPLQVVRCRYGDMEQEKTRNRQTLYSLLQQNPATLKGVKFTCEAMLISFTGYTTWSYASCVNCNKASTLQEDTYFCEDHGKQDPVIYRYRFKATAADGTATAYFTFFRKPGKSLQVDLAQS